MTGSIITEAETGDPTDVQVAQVRAFNRFYTNVIGVLDRKSTRLNSSHNQRSRMPSSA